MIRSGCHQEPWPPPSERRQPVLRVAVQDAEVPAGFPGAVWLDAGGAYVLPEILRLVQPRAPALRHRLHDASGNAHRPSAAALRCAPRRTRASLCAASATLQGTSATTTGTTNAGRHQLAEARGRTGGTALHSKLFYGGVSNCLTRSAAAPGLTVLKHLDSPAAHRALLRAKGPKGSGAALNRDALTSLQLAPICRKSAGSFMPKDDSGQ